MMGDLAPGTGTIVLVTGASGFIGKRLVARLSDLRRFRVRAVVRRQAPDMGGALEQTAFGDIAAGSDWREVLSGVLIVVHLAARAHVMHECAAEPLEAYRHVNVDGTLNLARQAAAVGVQRFVFISSVGVNGNATTLSPFSESDPPRPEEDYAISKSEAEQALRELSRQTGMEVVIIRPPLVYGPAAPGNFGRLVRLAQRSIPLPFGAVHNRRSLVALDNLVDFIITCMEHVAAANETFLVSDGDDVSTGELIRRLRRAMGQPSRLVPVPPILLMAASATIGYREAARRLIDSLQVDISKARRVLGWTPPVSVDEGLRRVAASVAT
jgi:nucleoside-diphosphate-sugar epimerase